MMFNYFSERKYFYVRFALLIKFILIAQISFAAPPNLNFGPPSADELFDHRESAGQANTYFDNVMKGANETPQYNSSDASTSHKEYDESTGTWNNVQGSVYLEPSHKHYNPATDYDPTEASDVTNNLKSLSNNPNGIDAATGLQKSESTGGSCSDSIYTNIKDCINAKENWSGGDAYSSAMEGRESNSHPSYYNDPWIELSRNIIGEIRTNPETLTACEFNTTIDETGSSTTLSRQETCKVFSPPPTCTVKREVVNVNTPSSCTAGDKFYDEYHHVYYAPSGGNHGMRIQTLCGGDITGAGNLFNVQLLSNEGWQTRFDGSVQIPADEDPEWKPISGAWSSNDTYPDYDIGHFFDCDGGCTNVYGGPVYRNHTCLKTGNLIVDPWICQIEIDFAAVSGTGRAWQTSNIDDGTLSMDTSFTQNWRGGPYHESIIIDYEAAHIVFEVEEALTYQPQGCDQSNLCAIKEDPYYKVPDNPTLNESSSTSTWECVDANNGYKPAVSPVAIDVGNENLEGIYYPSIREPECSVINYTNQIDCEAASETWKVLGPNALFNGDPPEILCWEAVARNYSCGTREDLGDSSSFGTLQQLQPDGSYITIAFNEELVEDAKSGCDGMEADNTCSILTDEPTILDNNGTALVYERTYECGITFEDLTFERDTDVECDSVIHCIGEECFETADEGNEDFGQAAAMQSVLGEAKNDMVCDTSNPDECVMFLGEEMSCHTAGSGLHSCCEDDFGASNVVGYLATIEFARLANAQLDLTGKAFSAMPDVLQEGLTGSWDYIAQKSAATAELYQEYIGQPLMSFIESFMGEAVKECTPDIMATAAEDGIVNTLSTYAVEAAHQFVSVACSYCAQILFTTTETAVGTQVAVNQYITTAFNVLMYAYLSYQMYMLALSLIYPCEEIDITYQARKKAKSCTRESKVDNTLGAGSLLIVGALAKSEIRYGACCFANPLARILQEQAELQMAREPFGNLKNGLNCDGLSVAQIGNMDWEQVDLSEWISYLALSGQIPNGSVDADLFFSQENIGRGTLVSDGLISASENEKLIKKETYEANRDESALYIIDKELELIQTKDNLIIKTAEITKLQNKINEAYPTPLEEDIQEIEILRAEQTVLIEKIPVIESEITKAENLVIEYQNAITSLNTGELPELSRTTPLSRLEDRFMSVNGPKRMDELRTEGWNQTSGTPAPAPAPAP
jgi:hypothetical protein